MRGGGNVDEKALLTVRAMECESEQLGTIAKECILHLTAYMYS